jgi:hypothetical protein
MVTNEQLLALKEVLDGNSVSYVTNTVDQNLHDYIVEGIVVFSAFPWPFETFFSNSMVHLMIDTYKDKKVL